MALIVCVSIPYLPHKNVRFFYIYYLTLISTLRCILISFCKQEKIHKIQQPFRERKTAHNLEGEGNILNLIKVICDDLELTSGLILKDWKLFSFKNGNEARMFALTISIQHFTGDAHQCYKARKRNSSHTDWKARNITVLIWGWYNCLCRKS